jgi:hypothetical protein
VRRHRARIAPLIGHLKSVHQMIRNYLKGTLGDAINMLIAVVANNRRHWMNKLLHYSFVSCLLARVRQIEKLFFENQQQYPRLRPHLATVAR